MGGEPYIVTNISTEANGTTNVVTLNQVRLASRPRRRALNSMTDGMEMNYKHLDGVLAG